MENLILNSFELLGKSSENAGDNGKIRIIVEALRLAASDNEIQGKEIYISSGGDKFGFTEGSHNLGVLLYFLADMLEE